MDSRRTTEKSNGQERGDKSYKICSLEGGLATTRYISRDTQSFFSGAIDDVELIREVISATASNGGVGHRITLAELNATLDKQGRGYCDSEDSCSESIQTTVEAGLGYVDDRPDRNIDVWVGLLNLGEKTTRRNYLNSTSKLDPVAELEIIQAASFIIPWIIDRKAQPKL
ncbi:hypothetical protein ACHAXR_012560, partial [Thalassiosira sp. AJA248-18]